MVIVSGSDILQARPVAAKRAVRQAKKALTPLPRLQQALRDVAKPAAVASAAQIVTALKPLVTLHQPDWF